MLKLVWVLKPWARAYVGSRPRAPKRTNSKPAQVISYLHKLFYRENGTYMQSLSLPMRI